MNVNPKFNIGGSNSNYTCFLKIGLCCIIRLTRGWFDTKKSEERFSRKTNGWWVNGLTKSPGQVTNLRSRWVQLASMFRISTIFGQTDQFFPKILTFPKSIVVPSVFRAVNRIKVPTSLNTTSMFMYVINFKERGW